LEEALAIYEQLDHQGGRLPVLGNLGMLYRLLGAYERSRDYLEESLALTQALGQAELRMYNLEEQSRLYHALGDGYTAYGYALQALEAAQALGSPLGIWGGETCIGNALAALEDWAGAEEAHRAAWEQQQRLGQGSAGMENLAGLAGIALAQGQPEAALAWVESILAWLAAHEPASVSQLLAIQWVCYQVLQANGDARAAELLGVVYTELHRRAAALTDPDLRRSFLEAVPVHREIIQTWSVQAQPS
jgi:tetratricopeptide (TPR) repeat protein